MKWTHAVPLPSVTPWLFCQFKKFGLVRNIWVARQPPGFAFVVMEDDRDAEDAIHKMDGKLFP